MGGYAGCRRNSRLLLRRDALVLYGRGGCCVVEVLCVVLCVVLYEVPCEIPYDVVVLVEDWMIQMMDSKDGVHDESFFVVVEILGQSHLRNVCDEIDVVPDGEYVSLSLNPGLPHRQVREVLHRVKKA